MLLDLCHPLADLPKSPDGGGDSDRATDTACVTESGTRVHVVSMCSHVCNRRARETQMRNRQVNHKTQKSNSLNESKLDKEKNI